MAQSIESIVDDAQREMARLQALNAELLAACKFALSVTRANGIFETSERLSEKKLMAAIANAEGR